MSAGLQCEVAVVGGGLVGAAMALGLSRQGVEVCLIDRDGLPPKDNDYDLRVYALSPASIALLEQLDVWPAIQAERVSPYGCMRIWETDPASALVFDAADAHRATLGAIVESRVIHQALWTALPEAQRRVGIAVTDLKIDDDGAQLRLADDTIVNARLVIAADGARSPLRTQLGIEVLGQAYEQQAVVCHVRTEKPHRGEALQRFLPTGPLAFLPLADGRSSIVWSSSEAGALMALDDWTFRLALDEAIQHALGSVLEVTPRVCFPLRVQEAQDYVQPRLALVGDAAHVVHPLAGQGLNLGFGDVQTLLQVLGEARSSGRDPGALRVLARYQRARRVAVRDMIVVTDGLYRAYRLQLPGWDWLRQRGLAAVGAVGPLRRQLVRQACGL